MECVQCGNEIEDSVDGCARCGHWTSDATPTVVLDVSACNDMPDREDDIMQGEPLPSREAPVDLPAGPAPQPPGGAGTRSAVLPVAAVVVVVSGLLTVILLRGHDAAAPASVVTAAPPQEESPPQPVPASHVETPDVAAPRWHSDNRITWLGRGNRGVVFEVAAENTVGVWMRNVRPSLVVRCTGGGTEVFVFTQSPARLEPGTEDHTVTVAFDEGGAISELWPDSIEHDALFAPDGAAFARRLLGARSMRFGFTPHNAAPVVARFHVEGLGDLLRPSARECGGGTESSR